jgi:hypothetical protein
MKNFAPIGLMTHFDKVPRRIGWSEIEFSHRPALDPTPIALLAPHSQAVVFVPARLSFGLLGGFALL